MLQSVFSSDNIDNFLALRIIGDLPKSELEGPESDSETVCCTVPFSPEILKFFLGY
jgi:hypothetical protein